ncbi:MAG TPA: aspartyl protease family protein [Patescibacteria group bacterium]|nr:aspartyl protease family protein [Patescibacteria group bacterium]
MGVIFIKLIVKNIYDTMKQTEENFLVDSGAHFTVLPLEIVKKLELKPIYVQEFSLADGRLIKRKLGNALIRFEDKELAVPVVLGNKGDTALLGVTTLESFGLMLDPFKRRIYHSKLMFG